MSLSEPLAAGAGGGISMSHGEPPRPASRQRSPSPTPGAATPPIPPGLDGFAGGSGAKRPAPGTARQKNEVATSVLRS